jgi:hypothetical protein
LKKKRLEGEDEDDVYGQEGGRRAASSSWSEGADFPLYL